MSIKRTIVAVIAVLTAHCSILPTKNPHIVTFFIRELPHTKHDIMYSKPVSGIPIAYNRGYIDVSDSNGQVLFPRKEEQATFNILVTQHITPILMLSNTVHHWEIQKECPAKMFTITQKKDPKASVMYWKAKNQTVPANRIIPLNTFIMLTAPDNVFVPTGITITTRSPQFVLPDVYIAPHARFDKDALKSINLRMLFTPVTPHYHQLRTLGYAELIKD